MELNSHRNKEKSRQWWKDLPMAHIFNTVSYSLKLLLECISLTHSVEMRKNILYLFFNYVEWPCEKRMEVPILSFELKF